MDDVKEMYPMLFGQKCADDLDKESFLQAFCVEMIDYIAAADEVYPKSRTFFP